MLLSRVTQLSHVRAASFIGSSCNSGNLALKGSSSSAAAQLGAATSSSLRTLSTRLEKAALSSRPSTNSPTPVPSTTPSTPQLQMLQKKLELKQNSEPKRFAATANQGTSGAAPVSLPTRVIKRHSAGSKMRRVTDEYDIFEVVGRGSYGAVHRGKCKKTRELVAIKVLEKSSNPSWDLELELWKRVSGKPHIVQLKDSFETPKEVFAVMEFAPGPDLFNEIAERETKNNRYSEKEALRLLLEMLEAVEICHLAGFAHLDIKPENFIFGKNRDLLLLDFGAAEPFQKAPYAADKGHYVEGLDDQIRHLDRIRGTASYVSPEIFAHSVFSSRSDVWSVGISFFLILTGMRPLDSSKESEASMEHSIKQKIMDIGNFEKHKHRFECSHIPFGAVEKKNSKEVVDLLKQLLSPRSKDRLSSTEAIERCKELLKQKGGA